MALTSSSNFLKLRHHDTTNVIYNSSRRDIDPTPNPNRDLRSTSTCHQESYVSAWFDEDDWNEQSEEDSEDSESDLLSILPFEVISLIFYHACRVTFFHCGPLNHPPRSRWKRDCCSPLKLGQLSRRYRRYAWAASELWTTIIIHVIPGKVATQTALLNEWLGRTMGRPIDVFFSIDMQVDPMMWEELMLRSDNPQFVVEPMILLLARYSRKWRWVEFHIPSSWYRIFGTSWTRTDYPIVGAAAYNDDNDEIVHPQMPLDLPTLESASLHCNDGFTTFQSRGLELDLTLAPSLHALSLSFIQMSPTTTFTTFVSLSQITHLTFTYVYSINLYDLMLRMPNLHQATFHQTTFQLLDTVGKFKFRHYGIRLLEMDVHAEEQLSMMLCCVVLPRLERLSVCVPTTMDYPRVFRRFTVPPQWHSSSSSSSSQVLTSLSLSCKITREFHLIDVLAALKSLRELYLRDSSTEATAEFGLSGTFFDVLHPDEFVPQLPCLEYFSYEGNLVVQAIDFLEPLVLRSRMRFFGGGRDDFNLDKFAVLRKVRIRADQVSNCAEFSIAECSDSQFVWEVMMMMEQGILELVTMDGRCWE